MTFIPSGTNAPAGTSRPVSTYSPARKSRPPTLADLASGTRRFVVPFPRSSSSARPTAGKVSGPLMAPRMSVRKTSLPKVSA
ncbi:hypothetical protein OJF2_00700 [Aquisphaera giovannonii]|uniref:Uncharacterized protein n=1 Tax=Aquisphaera giovannonii TaxID=406548 RepID=A0A5B9VV39_9BACT|nr:hypothetical protein [Aquisphaera giovannonii]QEH31605.1 hypothetical protein OJF2_00700 [Aquisphaera giovannonii]